MLYYLLSQKNFLLFTFYLSLFTFSYALPFQALVAGDYSCFSSEESIFDANAQDIGASLTIAADNSYTFTTSSASENGSVTVSEDTSTDLDDFFQSGSSLSLQPASGNSAYIGMFVTDKQGGMYVIIQNSNGLWIRCESAGADIANAIKQIATEQEPTTQPDTTETTTTETTTTETTTTPEQPATPNTINADAPEPGHYTCRGYTEYVTDVGDYKYGDIFEMETSQFGVLSMADRTLDIFANGEYSYHDYALFETVYDSLGILEWPETVGRYSFHHNLDRYDPGYTSLDWLTGRLREQLYNETDLSEYDWDYTDERPSVFYLGDNGHTEIFLGQEDAGFSLERTICTWESPNKRPTPSEVMQATETPENYLQPENITAPTPAAGAGGLNGLYVSGEGDTLYFMPNGYVYEGIYRWGFDTLASSNVCSRYWTEEANNSKAICSTYLIQGSGIQIGERVPASQQECSLEAEIAADGVSYEYVQNCDIKEGYNPATEGFLPFSQNADGTLSIDNVQYFPVVPEQNLTLDGTYEYAWGSWSSTVATGGTKTMTFTQDGQFVYGGASYLGGVFPQGSNTNSVTVTNDMKNPNAGTYSISGYTLTLSFNTGLNINYSFFRTDEDAFRLLNYAFTRASLQ